MGIIAWNIPNMITIILMAVIGYVALALIAQFYLSYSGGRVGSGSSLTGTDNTTLNWAAVGRVL